MMRSSAIFLVIAVLLLACSSFLKNESLDCEDISNFTATHLELESLRFRDANDWINSKFTVSGNIMRDTYPGTEGGYTEVISWWTDSKRYNAYFIKGKIASLRRDLQLYDLNVDALIDCVGEPDRYLAYRAPMGEHLLFVYELWYPSKGWVFRGQLSGGATNHPIHLTPETKVTYLEVTHSSKIEEIATLTSPTSANAQTRLEILRDWTPEWENMVYEELAPHIIPP